MLRKQNNLLSHWLNNQCATVSPGHSLLQSSHLLSLELPGYAGLHLYESLQSEIVNFYGGSGWSSQSGLCSLSTTQISQCQPGPAQSQRSLYCQQSVS